MGKTDTGRMGGTGNAANPSRAIPLAYRLRQVVMICAICMAFAPSSLAQENSARARQILSNPVRPFTELREGLLAIGDAAIEPVVEALADERQESIRQTVLVEVLGSLHSRRSNRALAHLLDDTRPIVRANAASVLGRNHEVCGAASRAPAHRQFRIRPGGFHGSSPREACRSPGGLGRRTASHHGSDQEACRRQGGRKRLYQMVGQTEEPARL
jgi:hypothetical protein